MRRNRKLSRRIKRRSVIGPLLFAVIVGTFLFFSFSLFISPDASSDKGANLRPSLNEFVSMRSTDPVLSPEPVVRVHRVDRNDTFYSILAGLDVPAEDILMMVDSARKVYDLSRLKKGDVLRVSTVDGAVRSVEYLYSELEGVLIERAEGRRDGPFSARIFEVPHRVETKLVSATIESSLYEAALDAGANPHVILLLSDIFAWDVDFATDIRRGDSFRVLYEVIVVDGRPIKTGRVLAAEMVNAGRRFTALYYEDETGRGDYYTPEGKSLSRTLLKSPLRYRRISSHFSKKRYHPVLKKYTPHHGIDYAAPTGTPVEAAGDGRVVFAGWKRGYGYFVRIRHNSTYTTAYGHFSRIRKGIKKGVRVRQGEVIGYVGSTGLSTGPHLHYEVKVRGRLVNPLSIKSSPRRSIDKKEMKRFTALRDRMLASLAGKDTLLASETGSGRTKAAAHP